VPEVCSAFAERQHESIYTQIGLNHAVAWLAKNGKS